MAKLLRCWLVILVLWTPINVLAQASTQKPDAQNDRITKLEQQIADSKGSADNAWMLMSSALVLLMTGPGLALFYAGTIPAQTFMVYQLMFAIITPALITGAFAERMKFSAMVVFMVAWSALVY